MNEDNGGVGVRHGETGQFVRSACPDDNCGGDLITGQDKFGDPVWHCDGLTFRGDDGALLACPREVPRWIAPPLAPPTTEKKP